MAELTNVNQTLIEVEYQRCKIYDMLLQSNDNTLFNLKAQPNANTIFHLYNDANITYQKGGWAYGDRTEFDIKPTIYVNLGLDVEKFNNTKIIEQIGHGLVTLIENGEINSAQMDKLLRNYLQPMIEAKVDYLVLGCSHYPYLIPQIKKIIPEEIKIIDSGEAVARQVKSVLIKNDLLNNKENKGNCIFYTNSNPRALKDILNFNYKIIEKDF